MVLKGTYSGNSYITMHRYRVILHIDMDAFFASVEQLDRPELKGQCVIVGGQSDRGVVAAASYEARKFGIRSAMPVFQAKQKCAHLVVVSPRKDRYKELSEKIMSLLESFSPLVEPVSIDEAYVDITGCERVHGNPKKIAVGIKQKIQERVGLSCSIGIAPNKFLAKIASDMEKPDGLTIIMPNKVMAVIESLPVQKVPGVGKIIHKELDIIGIKTLEDVKRFPEKILVQKFGKLGKRLLDLSRGIDNSPVMKHTPVKSVSSEETLGVDTSDKKLLNRYILKHSEDIGKQLRKIGVRAKTVTLKVKHSDFKRSTRSVTIEFPTQSSATIYREAKRLLENYPIDKSIRLIGIGASGLVSVHAPIQMDLFHSPSRDREKWEKVDAVVDAVTKKFGKNSIKKANIFNH